MPTLEDINEIKSHLFEIGHEPSILAERGESPVDIEPPETGLPEDLNDLFGEEPELEEPEPEEEIITEMSEESADVLAAASTPEVPDFSDMVPEAAQFEEEFSMDDTEALEAGFGMEDFESEEIETGPEEPESFDSFDLDTEDDGVGPASEEEFTLPDLGEEQKTEDSGFSDSETIEFEDENLETPGLPEEDDFSLPEMSEEPESIGLPEGDEDFSLPEIVDDTVEQDESLEFDLSMEGEAGESESLDTDIDLSPEGSDSSEADDLDLEEFKIVEEDSEDEDFEVDEFNLGDLGQDFGVLEDTEDLTFSAPESTSFELTEPGEPDAENGELEGEPFQISDEDFNKLTATLNILPRNLKLIIEEYIGEKNLSGEKLKRLTDALIAGKSPKEIASVTSRITGQKIKIPSRYEKRSGINFEEEKQSFAYMFRHSILPLLKLVMIGIVLVSALTYVGYKFIYKPVYALVLYNKGYKQLENQYYTKANEYFDRAVQQKIFRKQFYRYAEGFSDDKQWNFSEKKYDQLLRYYPLDKKGTLDYARMEFESLYNYEKASDLLKNFLKVKENVTDYDALLLYGDVNLEWGGENPSSYEEARRAYARIMKNYGVTDKVLFRMMKYFIRTDDPKEVDALKERFQADDELVVEPDVYAELAEYQINRNDLDDVKDLLFRAREVDQTLPEIHYQLARFFRKIGDPIEEDKALAQAMHYLKEKEPLSLRRREEMIDIYRRTGERYYAKKEYLHAQESYTKGIELLQESRKLSVVRPGKPDYGKMYADLGDIYYFISGDLDRALSMYETAEKEEYHDTLVNYKKGFIYYTKEDYRKALLDFYNAAGDFSTNTNLLFATANTLFEKGDLFLAQGYYNHLMDILENRLNSEIPLQLNMRHDQQKLMQNLVAATNNLGVTMYGLYMRTGDPDKFTQALVSFTESNDYFDTLTRDPETLTRADLINLAFLNQKKLLYPVKDYTLQIYRDIPKDMEYLNFD